MKPNGLGIDLGLIRMVMSVKPPLGMRCELTKKGRIERGGLQLVQSTSLSAV